MAGPDAPPDLRFGVLGAARIAPAAVVKPAAAVAGVRVHAVAARDPERARAFAAKHGIPTVHDSYRDLLDDADVDAVYNPLPNGLHAEWTLAALEAGKHVLCEKPFTANADEATHVADVAGAHPDLVVMEAFHYRYHPLVLRAVDLLADGRIGNVEHVETWVCFPLPRFSDIRYQYDLAGGALMDAGCYAVHMARTLAGAEPSVATARARLQRPDVDRAMDADVTFPSGATGRIHCSMWSRRLLHLEARVRGERGELRIRNPLAPHLFGRLRLRTPDGRTTERAVPTPTYTFQMRAFLDAVRNGTRPLTGPADAVANMRAIDAIYEAAGLPRRGT